MEKDAISEHQDARYELGTHESINGNDEREVEHWIIKWNTEEDATIKTLMKKNTKDFSTRRI